MSLKRMFILSLLFNIVLFTSGSYFVSKKVYYAFLRHQAKNVSKKHSDKKTSEYFERVSLFRILPDHQSDIYFVGDSITATVEWHELTSVPEAKNRGICGDDTQGILDRIDEIFAGKPRKIFIMCGINDIQDRTPLAKSISDYSRILSILQEKSPESRIYVEGLLPINIRKYRRNFYPKHPRIHIPQHSQVEKFNESLRKLAGKYRNVQFISLDPLVNASGNLIDDFTDDGLHLNSRGIQAWSMVLKPYISDGGKPVASTGM